MLSRNHGFRHSLLVVLLFLFGFNKQAISLENVPDVPVPKHWDNFVILVWQFQTNASKDKALYESVNIRGFHIDRKDANLQAFANETKWPFYVDHAADKGYLHLGKNAGSVKGAKGIIVRPNSLVDPKTIAAMKGYLKENIGSAKGSSVVAYSFDDEVSLGSFCTPAEVDGSPQSIDGYRKNLEKLYGTIEKLNAQYGTAFKEFTEISPRSYETYRLGLRPDGIGQFNLSQWCDWRGYMDTQFADCMTDLTKYANSLDPNVPAGFVGAQGPNAWGGYDYRKLCNSVQWMEAYDSGGNNEILRSFWTQKRPHVQTYFPSKDPHVGAWFLWYYLAHGNRGVIAWPAGWFPNGQVAPHIKALAETYKEVQGPVSKTILDGEFVHDPVAIYYSHPSIQVTWAMDAVTHGGTWVKRSSSMDQNLSTSYLTRIGWIKTLEDQGIQAKFVHQDHLLAGDLEKGGFKVLLLTHILCLSDAEAAAIKAFAAKGGTVIADHFCGVFDEHGKARAKGVLDDLFGVKRDLAKGILGGKTLTEVDGEKDYKSLSKINWDIAGAPLYKDVAVYDRGLTTDGKSKAEAEPDGTAVVVRNGKAIYLNLSPIGYLLKRSGNLAKDWMALTAGLLKEAGVSPRLTLQTDGQPAHCLEPIFWKNGERITLCLIHNMERTFSVDDFGDVKGGLGKEKQKLKLAFAKPVKDLKNERTGKALGSGKEFEDEFTPWEANVYTYTP